MKQIVKAILSKGSVYIVQSCLDEKICCFQLIFTISLYRCVIRTKVECRMNINIKHTKWRISLQNLQVNI